MGRPNKKRRTPAGLASEGGYIDTLTAFEKYTDWGDASAEKRRDMVLCMGAVLPYVRRSFAHPIEFTDWLARMTEATPDEALPGLWALLLAATALVDAEKKPGRITKKKAKALGLRCYTDAELHKWRAAKERLKRRMTPHPEVWTMAREARA